MWNCFSDPKRLVVMNFTSYRFLHPIVYGEYPRTIQEIVGDRLPKFTKDEVKMVKGSMDFVGINEYTAYYMYDPHQPKPKVLGYQQDWNAGFACKSFSIPLKRKKEIRRPIMFCHFSVNPFLPQTFFFLTNFVYLRPL